VSSHLGGRKKNKNKGRDRRVTGGTIMSHGHAATSSNGGCCRVELANGMNPWLSCQELDAYPAAPCLSHFENPDWGCGGFTSWYDYDHSMVYYVPGHHFWQYCSVEEGHSMPLAFSTQLPGPMDQYKCETLLNSTWETSECPDKYDTNFTPWGGRPYCYDPPTYGQCETSVGCITTHKIDCDNCGGEYVTGSPSPDNRYWPCLCNCQDWYNQGNTCPGGEHCKCFGGYPHCVPHHHGPAKPGMGQWPEEEAGPPVK